MQQNQQEAEVLVSVADAPEPSLPIIPASEVAAPVIPDHQEQSELTFQPTATIKQAKHKTSTTSKSTAAQEPPGVQLSLFDVGLNLNTTAIKSVPPSPAKVEPAPVENKPQLKSMEASGDRSSSTLPPTPTNPNPVEKLVDPMQIFQQVVDRLDKLTGEKLASLQASSPSLNTLRDWYKAARELDKSQKYLDRISEIATNFKQGELLTDKAVATMQADLQARYKKLAVVEQINQFPDNEFLLLHQAVDNYFKAAPPSPPKETAQQSLAGEVNQLVSQINSLGRQQADALATVEAMQKNPLRNWNGKYDAGVTQVKQIASKLENAIAYKQQKDHQLGQWDKQAKAHQAWNKDPQTIEMRSLLEGLKSPQALERLANIDQKLLLRQEQLAGGQPRSDRGPGLSV